MNSFAKNVDNIGKILLSVPMSIEQAQPNFSSLAIRATYFILTRTTTTVALSLIQARLGDLDNVFKPLSFVSVVEACQNAHVLHVHCARTFNWLAELFYRFKNTPYNNVNINNTYHARIT